MWFDVNGVRRQNRSTRTMIFNANVQQPARHTMSKSIKLERPPVHVVDAMHRLGLAGLEDAIQCEALTGGVSSSIWRLDVNGRRLCLKQALEKLRVAQDWYASTDRNRYEWKWLKFVADIDPRLVPELFGRDDATGVIAMEFLDPNQYRNWKADLLRGDVDVRLAENVGRHLALIHRHSTTRADLAQQFPDFNIFDQLRIDPYLRSLIPLHPQIQMQLSETIDSLCTRRVALIHGDVSPKNILAKDGDPVLLDAECACIGDAAFDLAFCLNHLLLKVFCNPHAAEAYRDSFIALSRAYLREVTWEPRDAFEARAARLLPALFLARVDGKSPVEYISSEFAKDSVRQFSISHIQQNARSVMELCDAWFRA